jgi:hypothetical protein|tara:strand:+ start:425 stop:808 length:384 start_codon:yes stop_codon:yes gene_type:complete
MATVTLTGNGRQATVGTVYSPNATAWLFTIKNESASAIDLRAEDDAVDETVEQIVREFNPLAYFITNSTAGTMHMILDKGQSTAADLQVQLRRIGKDAGTATVTSVGPNDIDISGSTVAIAATFLVA